MPTGAAFLAVAVGGATGACLRFATVRWIATSTQSAFPYGTLVVNVVGCFAIGVVATLAVDAWELSDAARAGLVVGVLGGLTTFSSFGLETLELLREERLGAAIGNVVANNVLGLTAAWLGLRLAQRLVSQT